MRVSVTDRRLPLARFLRAGYRSCISAQHVTHGVQMVIVRHEANKVHAKVVEANGVVTTAGIIPSDLTRDIKGQTAEVLAEIDRLLALCGTNKSRITSASIWLNDIRHRESMNEVWIDWVGGEANAPVRACVEAKLVDPRMLVEIQVIAVK